MKQYVVAMCMPDDYEINKQTVIKVIKEHFFPKNKNNINVVLIDYDALSGAEKYDECKDLQIEVLKYVDTLVFTSATLKNKKYREYLIKALSINNIQINNDKNRKLGIEFINIRLGV